MANFEQLAELFAKRNIPLPRGEVVVDSGASSAETVGIRDAQEWLRQRLPQPSAEDIEEANLKQLRQKLEEQREIDKRANFLLNF